MISQHPAPSMMKQLFFLNRSNKLPLHTQVRQLLVDAILNARLPVNQALPSSRLLANQLNISRNTVNSVYAALKEDGLLISRSRSGYFINPDILDARAHSPLPGGVQAPDKIPGNAPDWERYLTDRPSLQRNIIKPPNWQAMTYPFISGQMDPQYFPLSEWRECSRNAMSVSALRQWASDSITSDDPELVEQIRTRLLPRRGIWVEPDEILVTVGSQQALHLIASVLMGPKTKVGIENPSYPDARNLFERHAGQLRFLPVDENGLVLDRSLPGCDIIFVTPSHQMPTTGTMPMENRVKLLELARQHEFLIIEDDYDSEINFTSLPAPALKSFDQNDRVIYVASLSKTLAPGLRIGYMVAAKELIKEARAMRRLVLRHPPANNQRTLALFLAEGGYDALAGRLKRMYQRRWTRLTESFDRHLQMCQRSRTIGGTMIWVRGPTHMNCYELAQAAAKKSVLIEPGAIHYPQDDDGLAFFKMGFSVIPEARIDDGVRLLSQAIDEASSR